VSAPLRLGRAMTLLVGGARSGKSDLAVNAGTAWSGHVSFVATAEAHDEDMASRITRHQAERPAHWTLIEAPRWSASDVAQVPEASLLIVDCITLLVSNLFLGPDDEQTILAHVDDLGAALGARTAPTIVISNEVGLGVHPATELGREYRDILGRANRTLAGHADAAFFVVAGMALPLNQIEIQW